MSDETARPNDRADEHDDAREPTAHDEPTEETPPSTADEEPVETAASGASSDVEALQRELESKDQRLQETVARLQRTQADFENYKKRVARERDEETRRTQNETLLEILPVFDGFERAFTAYERDGDATAFIEGMERVFAQFRDVLADHDVHPIEAEGQPFDPSRHEALMSVESTEHAPNTVLEAFERGYVRGNEVLRPSRVKVSRKPATSNRTSQGDSTDATNETDGSETTQADSEGGTD